METPENKKNEETMPMIPMMSYEDKQAEMYAGFETRLDNHKIQINKNILSAILIIVALYILSQYMGD